MLKSQTLKTKVVSKETYTHVAEWKEKAIQLQVKINKSNEVYFLSAEELETLSTYKLILKDYNVDVEQLAQFYQELY